MNGKSLLILGLAMGFGLIAMLVSQQMLAQEPAKTEEAQEVLVAARDLKEEEVLKADAVKVIRMAKSAVPPGAFPTARDIEERWVKTAMLEGDVIIEKKLGPKGTPPGLVANIPKGMRAFAIDVTEQTGVSGFVLPGHRVDVIRYESQSGEQHAEGILQDILVLASGQVFTRADERSLTTRTVTLALTPEQVDILVAARARGQLSLSLRGVNDHDVVARQKPTPSPAPDPAAEARWKAAQEEREKLQTELAALKETLAARAKPVSEAHAPRSTRQVHIYRGGREPTRLALDGTGTRTGPSAADRLPAAIPGPALDALDRSGSSTAGLVPAAGPGTVASGGAFARPPAAASTALDALPIDLDGPDS